MKADIQRTATGSLMLTIAAETEVEGIALERWQEENKGIENPGLMTIAGGPQPFGDEAEDL